MTVASRLLITLFIASVFLLNITEITDTDAWLHLSLGKAIFDHGGIPETELFTYPNSGKAFTYGSWLFGLIYYTAYHFFNVYGVILLKALTITATFYLLIRDSLSPYKNCVAAVLVMTVIFMMAEHRFIERPDTFLMLFLSFLIYSLSAYVYENKKYIYALPFVHVIWANTHSSINLMFVPFLSFIAGGILQKMVNRLRPTADSGIFQYTPSSAQLKTILLIFLLSFGGSLISPYSKYQFTSGASVLGSDWWSQEIVELARPTWESNKWPFIMSSVLMASFAVNWLMVFFRRSKKGINRLLSASAPPLIHLFIAIPFILLSFKALRFVFLLGIVSGPILARNISQLISSLSVLKVKSLPHIMRVTTIIWVIAFAILTITNTGPFGEEEHRLGFGFNYTEMPEGALKYMDTKNIYGRVFNTFQWGQYIIWRDFPKRTVFVDGRGELTSDLLESLSLARIRPFVLDKLQKEYGFESVMLDYPKDMTGVTALHYETDLSLANPGWALVYWDDVSTLYLRRGGPYDAVIKEDEYRFVKPVNNIEGARPRLNEKDYAEGLINELKRNIALTGSSKAYSFLGFIYNERGLYRDAIALFDKAENKTDSTYLGLAYAYGSLNNLDEAIKYYKMAFEKKKDAVTLYNIGTAYFKKVDDENAIKYLSEALELEGKLTSIYPKLIHLYQKKGMKKEAENTARMYENANTSAKGEEHFKKALKAFFDNKLYIAAEEYKKSIEVNPSNPEAYSNLGYIYYDMDMFTQAYEYQRKALDVAPDFANAHYGLALIYLKWNDPQSARKHFQKYIEAEPAGYFTRRAKEEIEKLEQTTPSPP